MITVLGAGGAIGGELAKLLASSNRPFRLVGRNPRGAPGATETVAADLTDLDQAIHWDPVERAFRFRCLRSLGRPSPTTPCRARSCSSSSILLMQGGT